MPARCGAALRMFAIGRQAELARKEIEIAFNAAEIYAIAQRFYGVTSAKLAGTLHVEKLKMQLELLIGELEEEQAEGDACASAADPAQPHPAQTRERKQPVRKPPHLPRETVTYEPPCIRAGPA